MMGNNYLKQLAFGARANSPVPIVLSQNAWGRNALMESQYYGADEGPEGYAWKPVWHPYAHTPPP